MLESLNHRNKPARERFEFNHVPFQNTLNLTPTKNVRGLLNNQGSQGK